MHSLHRTIHHSLFVALSLGTASTGMRASAAESAQPSAARDPGADPSAYGSTGTAVAMAARPEPKRPPDAGAVSIEPYAVIVGGAQHEAIITREGHVGGKPIVDDREDRVVTLALAGFGLRLRLGAHVEIESELEANAGPHGTSVWEGQAALQVRDQVLRLTWWRLGLDAGRFEDPASVDFYSAHVADQLYTDLFTRQAHLQSGYNQGNGLFPDLATRQRRVLGRQMGCAVPLVSF